MLAYPDFGMETSDISKGRAVVAWIFSCRILIQDRKRLIGLV